MSSNKLPVAVVFCLAAFCIMAGSSCTQVQDDGARAFGNAGSVVRQGGENIWTPPSEAEQRRLEAEQKKK